MNSPTDTNRVAELWQGKDSQGNPMTWARELVVHVFWVGNLPYLLPWKYRVKVWNWMWNYSDELKVKA